LLRYGTLNRGGVRMGTAEFYAVVESLEDVVDSLAVHLEDEAGGPGELCHLSSQRRVRMTENCTA
jgi:acyl-coenzyme A synthetase/AMP-(fatty) acid ligase